MSRQAVIYAHPSAIHTPQDVTKLEHETGKKAVICRQGVKLVNIHLCDDYELVDRQSYLSTMGSFEGDAA